MAQGSYLQISFSGLLRISLYLTVICTLKSLSEGRPQTVENCGKQYLPFLKIVNGDVTIPGEYPWMVSLQTNYSDFFYHICGASIINEHYILTAAHCIDQPIVLESYEVVVGLYSLSHKNKKPAKVYKVSKIFVHKAYNDKLSENDIALIRTAEPIQFNESFGFVNGICLPETQQDPKGWATVTGWGLTTEGGNSSDTLLEVKIPMVPRDLCAKNYEEVEQAVIDTQICAGGFGRDSCQSDSGGPLVQKNGKGIYTLIGIVSYGMACADRKYPGVYTKVASYMDWIEDRMMGKPEPEPAPRPTTVKPTTAKPITVKPTTEDYSTTLSPQKNKTFSKLLMYSSNFQSKLIFMTQK